MSLSLALAAEHGRYGTVCCDGRLLFGDMTADVYAPKFQGFGEWIFMLAGELASADCVLEELRIAALDPKNAVLFTRDTITDTLLSAFNRRLDRWKFIRHLTGFSLKNMEDFKRHGRAWFGTTFHDELLAHMHKDARVNFKDGVMVVGWGAAAASLTIYSVSRDGDKLHTKDGHGAIGSGREQAIKTLLRLRHGINASLQDAIYATLAAKFSAESKTVGRNTTMWVLRNPREQSDATTRILVQADKLDAFRKIWRRHHRSRNIPHEAKELAVSLIEETQDEELITRNAAQRNAKRLVSGLSQITRSVPRRSRG